MSSNLLTATRLATLRQCARKHYLRYELGLSRIRTTDALRLGSAFHRGLELHNKGADAVAAIAEVTAGYATVPEWADPFKWDVEQVTVEKLLSGHFWRYENDDIEIVEAERNFEVPLVNPDTGATSRTFRLAGKIDGIVRLGDGRLAVLEYKTCSDDISTGSAYWLRLRCDSQISLYMIAARAIGYDVACVLYDVTRKPTIRPRNKPQPETADAYGVRLLNDIGERPDHYFQRREIPRLDKDLDDFRVELWQQAKQLLDSRRGGRWFRNVSRFTCSYCDFADLCLNGIYVGPEKSAPPGFQILATVHPELT